MKKKFLKTLLFLLVCSVAWAALEDYTTYTEVDEQGDITITSSTVITVSSMRRDADSYVTKDSGVGHFGDFTHNVKTSFTTSSSGLWAFWALANSVVDMTALDGGTDGMNVHNIESGGTGEAMRIKDFSTDNIDTTADINEGTRWLIIQRSGTTCTAKYYSDEYITLVDTLSIVCSADTFRYIYALQGLGSGTDASQASGTVEVLDLNEAAIAKTTIQSSTLQGATIN